MAGVLKVVVFLAVVALTAAGVSAQTHHVVGGWGPQLDVSSWLSGRVFTVGDKLWFKNSGREDSSNTIVEVGGAEEFVSCNLTNPLRMYTDNHVLLDKQGIRYFTSGNPDMCKNGLKMPVPVQPSYHEFDPDHHSSSSPPFEPGHITPPFDPSFDPSEPGGHITPPFYPSSPPLDPYPPVKPTPPSPPHEPPPVLPPPHQPPPVKPPPPSPPHEPPPVLPPPHQPPPVKPPPPSPPHEPPPVLPPPHQPPPVKPPPPSPPHEPPPVLPPPHQPPPVKPPPSAAPAHFTLVPFVISPALLLCYYIGI